MHVVVLRALYLGDFLTGVPAYRAVRAAFPAARISLAAPGVLAPLAALVPGVFDAVIDTRELQPLPPPLHGADVAVNLHGVGPQSHALLRGAGARRLLAFRHPDVHESADGAPFDPAQHADEHERERWCRLLRHYGIPASPDAYELAPPPLAAPPHAVGATLLHPGASSEARRWPVDRWIEVARAERRGGRRVILTGNDAERERVDAIATAANVGAENVYAGRTSILELAALVADAGRVVSGDTGVAHLATAYRRPSVTLFGPTPPSRWGPPAHARHRVLWRGRTGDPHAARTDPGLATITTDDVRAALASLPDAAFTARMSRATA